MKRARSSGFTIVEVMIVLAVTGLLFLSAASLISGKVDQTEFDQSVRSAQQQVQDTINEVSSGSFPDSSNFSCSQNGSTIVVTMLTQSQQGTNNGCIFLGKVIQFGVGANQDQTVISTIAGAQKNSSGTQEVTSLSTADPTILAASVANPNVPQDAIQNALEYGLHTYCSANCATNGDSSLSYTPPTGGTPQAIGAFAIVYSFAKYDVNGAIESSSEQLNLVPIIGSTLGMAAPSSGNNTADIIDSSLLTSPTVQPGGVVSICLASATTNQYGLITIGSNNSQLSVTLSIMSNKNGIAACP